LTSCSGARVILLFSKAREIGIYVIIGSEITVSGGSTIVLLARDRDGYKNLAG
jgi:DNA polymerase III alpha subunit